MSRAASYDRCMRPCWQLFLRETKCCWSVTHSTDGVRPFNETRQQAWFNADAYSDTDTDTVEPSDLGLLPYVSENETDGQIFRHAASRSCCRLLRGDTYCIRRLETEITGFIYENAQFMHF